MRQSILEGLNFSPPPPPPHPHAMPFYPPGGAFYPPPHMMPLQGRGRSMGMPRPWSSGLPSMSSQGGKLEIAGTVVGQWAGVRRGRGGFPIQVVSVGGPNRGRLRGVISTPVIRTFGRGAKFPLRGFKSQGTYQVGQGTYQVSQGTYQVGQGTYQVGQGTYQVSQGTYQVGQGTYQIGQLVDERGRERMARIVLTGG
uniref:Uncharacterized protein n=1 Tax=Hucho hucho TaxID=62062 RepID=A0A4W5L6B6_9TELE